MHKKLEVWEQSMILTENIYYTTKSFPEHEKFGLVNQLRRAAVSIPSNIAEGAARNSTKEYLKFLYIALGSASELETQLILSERLKYITSGNNLFDKIKSVRRLLSGLIKVLKRKIAPK